MKKNLMMILAAALGCGAWGAAEMNGTAYSTLKAAIQAAPTDGTAVTITMTSAETYGMFTTISLPTGSDITLDLNGFKVTVTGGQPDGFIHVQGSRLVITDTSASGAGEISKTDNGSSCNSLVRVLQNGKLVISGGLVKAAFSGNGINQGVAVLMDHATASVSITGGTVRGNNFGIQNIPGGTINISGGTVGTTTLKPQASVFAYAIASNGPVTISDGTVECLSSDGQAVATGDGATSTTAVQISGGTITSVGSGIVLKNSTLEMTGGSVSGNTVAISALNNSEATIANSTVTSPIDAAKADATSEVTFLGGATYSGALDGDGVEIQEGSVVKDNSDGSHTIVDPNAPVPQTFSVPTTNMFGAVKITGNVASNLYVAVPFEGFESDGAPRAASNVVHAANLTAGAKLYAYDKGNDRYNVYESESGAWKPANKVTVNAEGKAVVETADLGYGVTAGTGVILERKSTSEAVYVYGQVPAALAESVTFGSGQTLVSPPYTNATVSVGGVKYVDLNAFTWTGVKATEKKRLKNQAGADYIQFRTAENKLVKYFYLVDGGWGVVPTQVSQFADLVSGGKALVPAGTAFWYYSNNGGAKVEWK